MLHFIFGIAGSGKTEYIRSSFAELVRQGASPLLVVPEQYSFETEKAMYAILGAPLMKNARISSFSRLARKCLSVSSGDKRPYITEGGRSAVMSLALSELADNLKIYSGIESGAAAITSLVAFDKELRRFEVEPRDIAEHLSLAEDGAFKSKLNELSLISEAYRAKLAQSYYDDTCILTDFAKNIAGNNLFKNETVFFDAFGGFSCQELSVLREIMQRAEDVYVSYCSDGFDGSEVFEATAESARLLRQIASEDGVKIAAPVHLNGGGEKRGSALSALEECFRCSDFETFEEKTEDINVVSASDKADECEFVASQARRLVREGGLRCRDIAVIERTEGDYKPLLINAFRRAGLPVFDDSRRSVMSEPLTVFALSALECAGGSFRTESIMSYLKTGLTDLTDEEICLLDNYTVVWGIDGGGWLREWVSNPDGFGAPFDADAHKRLEQLEIIRQKTVTPLLDFKNACKDTTGGAISRALFELCERMNSGDALKALKKRLCAAGLTAAAQELSEVWELFIDILEQCEGLTRDMYLSAARYRELFALIAGGSSFGTIPQGLDEITVGSAGRIRTTEPKAVFVVGVNEGVLPLTAECAGVLTDNDRAKLTSLGVELSRAFPYKSIEERFIVYGILTAPSKRLYLSYSRAGTSGEALSPSEVIDRVRESFPGCKYYDTALLSPVQRVESAESALREAAKGLRHDSTEESTLLELLYGTESLRGCAAALAACTDESGDCFTSPDKAKELFGNELYISATKSDDYYKCPFRYFCRYGLEISELRAAALDAGNTGTAVHYVLEQVLIEYPHERFIEATREELEQCAEKHLNVFLEEKLGGADEKTERFLYLYESLKQSVTTVLERLREEFSRGDFVPVRFELRIGGDEVPRYELPLSDGKLFVTGYIDRVDVMEREGERFIRVIDYKTGKKDFKLSDVTAGLNLQMCLYLAALGKAGPFSDAKPAGVLYLPSRAAGSGSYIDKRNPNADDIAAKKLGSGALSGMILADEAVIDGMGGERLKGYLPDVLYTLSQFGQLSRKIDSLLTEMGEALHRGEIPVLPKCCADDRYSVCDYCDYRSVCGFESGDRVREIFKKDNKKILAEFACEDEKEAQPDGMDG